MSLIDINLGLGTGAARTSAQNKARQAKVADARKQLIDAAWAVESEWWPDSPHTEALTAVLFAVEAALDLIASD